MQSPADSRSASLCPRLLPRLARLVPVLLAAACASVLLVAAPVGLAIAWARRDSATELEAQ